MSMQISYLLSLHVIYTQSQGRVLTRRTRQRRPTAMPSRGRLSVPGISTYSFTQHARDRKQYSANTLAYFHMYDDTVSTIHYDFIQAIGYTTIRLHADTVLLHSTYNCTSIIRTAHSLRTI